MPYQSSTGMFAYSEYIVDGTNQTQYKTIQAAINQAQLDGGNKVVYVRPGTYVEDLTLYDTVSIEGDSTELVMIAGVHIPPLAGSCSISNVILTSATHIFSSVAAGTATITLRNCVLFCTNGYAFNLLNWNGGFAVYNCIDRSTDNHGVNNTGASSLTIVDSQFGVSATTMTLSGPVSILGSTIMCPMTISGAFAASIDNGSTIYDTITVSGTVILDIRNSSLNTDITPVITTTSALPVILANVVINSASVPVLAGTGSIQFGEVTYLTNRGIAGTITQVYGTAVQTGILVLPNTNTAGTEGEIIVGGNRFVSNKGTFNTFVGQSSGNTSNTSIANTSLGALTMPVVTSGQGNLAAGYQSLFRLDTGLNNLALGMQTAVNLTSGTANVAIGPSALGVSTGGYNICIGEGSGGTLSTNESSNILLANTGVIGDGNTIRIGTQGSSANQQNKTYVAGIYNTAVGATNMPVVIDSTGKLGTNGSTSPVVSWSVITTNQTAVVNKGYICNKAGTLVLLLPATASIGDMIEVTGINTALGWQIQQNANQQVFIGAGSTTLGVAGTLTSSATRDSIKLLCVVAGASTVWNAIQWSGNITFA